MNILKGIVRSGKSRGKRMGFPTANIALNVNIPEGIYLSKTFVEQKELPSLTFIGSAKTFGEEEVQAEVYILKFSEQLYGKEIKIELIKKIRGNKKFGSEGELIAQMKRDEQVAREFFGIT